MDIAKPDSPSGIGSSKVAISIYGEIFRGRKPDQHRSLDPLSEDSQSKPRKIRLVQFDIENLNESKKFPETERAMPSKELAQLIQESDDKARARSIQNQNLKNPQRSKANDTNQSDHPTVIQELHRTNEELSLLKISVASLLQDKTKAEKDAEDSSCRLKSYESMAEELRKEIDEVDEEYVLVELARIEAEKERREIEAQREAEATHFLSYIETARDKIKHLQTEIDRAKELEAKLAEASSDVSVLQNEMELVRACREQTSPKKDVEKDEQENSSRLQSAVAELNSAKQELESIRGEGFRFMASMDLVRGEIMQIAIENQELKHLETKANSTVQNLSSKLRRAKSKLESAAASVADGKTTSAVSNLSQALQRLQTEISEAKREKETIRGVLETITAEAEKTNIHIKSAEEGLEAAAGELQLVKESEADAVKKLRDASGTVMKNRASASLNGSPVSMCRFEYDYLRRRAAASRGVADKKVAAARAWVEALRAEEKEILMRCELVRRENKEQELREALAAQRAVDAEASNKQLVPAMPRKSIRENGAHSGRAKTRRSPSTSGATRHIARSPSFTMRKKTIMLGSALCRRDPRSTKQQVSGPGGSN